MKKFLLLFFLPIFIFSQKSYEQIRMDISELLSTIPSSTKYSVKIYDPELDEIIFAENENTALTPASNIKLFTTAAALTLLGDNYSFSTRIYADSISTNRESINGNLYIKGFGNSLFTLEELDSLVQDLVNKGIKKIEGNIIGDDLYFDSIYIRDDWIVDEKANVNLPAVSALVIDRNKLVLKLFSNKDIGDVLSYEVLPPSSFCEVNITAKVSGVRARPKIFSTFSNDKYTINISGKMGKRKYPRSWAVFVEKPALYAAFIVYDLLRKYGVSVEGKPKEGKTPIKSVELNSKSIELSQILYKVNKDSDNYLAECLFKSLGAFYSNQQGNSFFATQAVMSFANDIGIETDKLSILDGSGISKFNSLTSKAIVELLTYMFFESVLFDQYYFSLAVAGIDGTLKDRMLGTLAEYNFRGKTGTLNRVSSISGYLTTKNNKDIIVTILMEFKENGANFYRNVQDKIISIIAESL